MYIPHGSPDDQLQCPPSVTSAQVSLGMKSALDRSLYPLQKNGRSRLCWFWFLRPSPGPSPEASKGHAIPSGQPGITYILLTSPPQLLSNLWFPSTRQARVLPAVRLHLGLHPNTHKRPSKRQCCFFAKSHTFSEQCGGGPGGVRTRARTCPDARVRSDMTPNAAAADAVVQRPAWGVQPASRRSQCDQQHGSPEKFYFRIFHDTGLVDQLLSR